MRFTPISEQEAASQSSSLWKAGVYDYEVRNAEDKTSSGGNEMTALEVWVYDQSGGRRLVFDYLVASENTVWKIRRFAESCGLLDQFDKGVLEAADCEGRTGRCKLAVAPAKDGYEAKNVIRDYIKMPDAPKRAETGATPSSRKPIAAGAGSDLDDEIPF